MVSQNLIEELSSNIICYKDFPKPGVLFWDFLPIFAKPDFVNRLCKSIANLACGKVDVVVGLEARGFLFGPQVAILLNLPFIPIRKKGKLPGTIISTTYIKEYGEDTLEIQAGVLKKGQRVFLLDDLLATGGTLKAAVDLIQQSDSIVSQIAVFIELNSLNGRNLFSKDLEIFSFLKY